MTNYNYELFHQKSQQLRIGLWNLLASSKKGHIPSSYSALEILISLFYGGHFHLPNPGKRDRLFISKGHAAMALYPILVDLGLVEENELQLFCHPQGKFRLYADPSIPLVEAVTGSLGHGLGYAIGHALSMKFDNQDHRSFVLLGDGECYEGSVWEAAMLAKAQKLSQITVIVDRNFQCIMGPTEELVPLASLKEKWQSFGFFTQVINGHHYPSIISALEAANSQRECPSVIIAQTVKGKGISFMEGKSQWHNKIPTDREFKQGHDELLKFKLSDEENYVTT